MSLHIVDRRNHLEPERKEGRRILPTEKEWLVEGPAAELERLREAHPGHAEPLTETLLLLDFRGAVGRYTLPGLGEVELVSGKWTERHFDEMLRELTEIAAGLPFAHRFGSGLPFERISLPERPVPYHAFVYLQYILSETAPSEERFDLAVGRVLAEPNRRLVPEERLIPVGQASTLGVRGMLHVLQTPGAWSEARHIGGPVAAALGGYLPERVIDERRERSVDTPENRFVLAALELASGIAKAAHEEIEKWKIGPRAHLRLACERVSHVLRRLRSHPLWQEVGTMTHLPSASTVLQRQYGYREVLRHFIRLRLLSRIPLETSAARSLLELKDLPTLYELWVFFAIVRALEQWLGPPAAAEAPDVFDGQLSARRGLRVHWADGTELLYNESYTREGPRLSTSVPLRPDVSLFLPKGRNCGLHLFDAKFRLDSLPSLDGDDEGEVSFKRQDLYKMHTYRDAIPQARSVWIVYPGTDLTFYSAEPEPIRVYDGVGAVPARPGESHLSELLRRLL